MVKLANNLARFPRAKFIGRSAIGIAPLAAGILLGRWLFWATLILAGILCYFLVGMTLYRNATPWRRIGHQGFTIWITVTSGLRAGRGLGAAGLDSDCELRHRALASTLRQIYPGLEWEKATLDATKYIAGATGIALENEIREYLTRNGREPTEAMAMAHKAVSTLQKEENIGGTIIAFTLALIIGQEFGLEQKDLYWAATFRGETVSM